MEHLSIREIHKSLEDISGWELIGDEITKEFNFADFKAALEFVNKVGEEAERERHHPDILIRYNKVRINLTTHSSNGLTDRDFKLARIIEQLF